MNIVVCVKQVMDTEALIELDDSGEVITEGRTQIIDPYGEFAVEKAVQLKEQLGGEVTCLCYGDDGCTSAIRHALAMGADKAVLIEDDAWRSVDAAQCTAELAGALKDLSADLIMGGWTSGDTASAQVMGRLSALLDIPLANMVTGLEATADGVKASCEIDDGVEICEYKLPVIIAAQQGLAEPRYPSVRDVMQARRKPIERKAPAGGSQPVLAVAGLDLKGARSGGRIIEGDTVADAVAQAASLLRSEAKVI